MFRRVAPTFPLYSASVSKRQANGRDSSTLASYLRQIARLPRLSVDEERDLGRRIRHHRDDRALSQLVEGNLRFVVSYAKRYRGCGIPALDLIHEGNLGLIEAARRFDPSRNVKFISYAVWWVREAMMQAMADQMRAFSFPPKLLSTLGHSLTDRSLSDPITTDARYTGTRELGETLAADEIAIDDAMIEQGRLDDLAVAIGDLDRKERQIMRWRFGLGDDEPRTLQQIGDSLHLSRERVRQLESRAKGKLRHSERLRRHLN
jgi:RNA polymerase primary sigma factor